MEDTHVHTDIGCAVAVAASVAMRSEGTGGKEASLLLICCFWGP